MSGEEGRGSKIMSIFCKNVRTAIVWMLVGATLTAGGYLLYVRQVIKNVNDWRSREADYPIARLGAFENGADVQPCTSNTWLEAEQLLRKAGDLEKQWRFLEARRTYTIAFGMYEAMAQICCDLCDQIKSDEDLAEDTDDSDCSPGASDNSQMASAKIERSEAWKLPGIDVSPEVDAEWHEAGDGTWFTNSVGDRISVERYCAVLNCTTEREVVPLLDQHYARCLPDAIQKMYETEDEHRDGSFWADHYTRDKGGNLIKGREASQDEVTAWRIKDNVYLVLSADDSGRMKIRMYTFVLFDGEKQRTIASFDYLPDPDMMAAILSVESNPDAINNVAMMYYNDEAWTHSVDDNYVVRLLTLAARFGSAMACENLALLGEKRGWTKEKIEKWQRSAKACRDAVASGSPLKMKLEDISEWPLLWLKEEL